MTEPTDEDLTTILRAHWPAETNDWASHMDFARAVLAKWGNQAQAAEPVAYLTRNAEGDPAMLFFDKDEASTYCEDWVDPAPLFTAPQPVAREPLSDEEVDSLCKVGPVYAPDGKVTRTPPQYRDELEAAQRYGLRKGERAHGIKIGGQHGTDT